MRRAAHSKLGSTVATGLAVVWMYACEATPTEAPDFRGDNIVVVALATESAIRAVAAEFIGVEGRFAPAPTLEPSVRVGSEEFSLPVVPDTACGYPGIPEYSCYSAAWPGSAPGPGDTLRLKARGVGGELIRGTTVLPQRLIASVAGDSVASVVLEPPFGFASVTLDEPSEDWSLLQVQPQRLVAHEPDRDVECGGTASAAYVAPPTSSPPIVVGFSQPICDDLQAAPDSFSLFLALSSYDSAYAAYWDATGMRGIPLSDASFGVEGVVGVFGSRTVGPTLRIRVVEVN